MGASSLVCVRHEPIKGKPQWPYIAYLLLLATYTGMRNLLPLERKAHRVCSDKPSHGSGSRERRTYD